MSTPTDPARPVPTAHAEPREPVVVPLDDPSVPASLVPIPGTKQVQCAAWHPIMGRCILLAPHRGLMHHGVDDEKWPNLKPAARQESDLRGHNRG